MNITVEARWFFKDEPTNISKWFQRMNNLEANRAPSLFGNQLARSDYYLNTDGYPKMAFKIREGKIEVKMLDEDFGLSAFGNNGKGYVRKWIKWSPELRKENAGPGDVFVYPEKFLK